jgi:uncharacterized protein
MYFALFYETVDNYVELRAPFRSAHLAHATRALHEGKLVMAGALKPDGALLVFRGESAADVEAFARTDPYVLNGVIKSWRIAEWVVVVGGDAETPARG